MIKKILCLVSVLLLCGCYNYQELNDIAIVTAVAVDKVEDKFHISYQIINPIKSNQGGSSNETDFIVLETSGKTQFEAVRNTILLSSRRLHGNHISVMVFSEKLAKTDIIKTFDYILRDPDVRTEFYVLIAKENEDFKNILKIITPLTNTSAKGISDSLINTNRFLGLSSLITFNDLLNMYLNPNLELTIPSIEIIGTEEKEDDSKTLKNVETTYAYNNLKLSTMSIFKDNKLLGYLTKNQTLTYNFIKNNIDNALITYNCDDDRYVVTEIISSKTSIEADVKKKEIIVYIKGNAELAENTCKINLKGNKEVTKLNNKFNKKIESIIKDSVKEIQSTYNTDVFGFRDLYYKTNPSYYKNIKDSWYEDIFPNLKIKVNSNIKIMKKGNAIGGIYE